MDQSLNSLSGNAYFSTEQDCHDSLNPPNPHHGYHANAGREHPHRDDNIARQHASSYPDAESAGAQYLADRPAAVENHSRFAANAADFAVGDSSGSLSSVTTQTAVGPMLANSFTQPYQTNHSQSFHPVYTFGSRNIEDVSHSFPGWRADPTAIQSVSPTGISREPYTYPSSASNLLQPHLAYPGSNATYPTTPRSGDSTLVQPFTPSTSIFDSTDMPANGNEQSNHFPFGAVQTIRQIETSTGEIVKPNIQAMATKGFFTAQGYWTCYRRNYFALSVWYDLGFIQHNTSLFVEGRQIKAFAMHLSANVEGQDGKAVELVQYTPKRDLGEKTAICTTKVEPSLPRAGMGSSTFMSVAGYPYSGTFGIPYLPLQHERESESPESPSITASVSTRSRFAPPGGQSTTEAGKHSFDRVQFKGATQNNGKRRASQQFYVLIVELLADVRGDDSKTPEWKPVALRPSDKLVVRGRSPSHYKDSDGRINGGHAGRGGNQGSFNNRGHQGSPEDGHGSTSAYNAGPSNTSGFRPYYPYSNHSSMSPMSNQSATSPSSNGETVTDTKHPMEPTMTRENLSHMQNSHLYRYFPASLYTGAPIPTKVESPGLKSLPGVACLERSDSKIAIAEDYPDAIPGRHWGHVPYNGYMGTDTSRGWFPELHNSSPTY